MGKYLKLFDVHSDYEAFTQTEDFIFPNVSFCLDQTNIVHFNPIVQPIQSLMVTYNVNDASNQTPLYFYNTSMDAVGVDMFDKVEIDGTEVTVADIDAANGAHQLSVGEHTVAYTLKDPTIIGVVRIGENNFKVNAVFMNCTAITGVTIPDSVTSIGISSFNGCEALTSIDIPNSVTTIGSGAFGGCSGLTSVTIPNTVTSIGDAAFYLCSGLTSVTVNSSTPPTLGSNVFNNTHTNLKIYVPSASVDTYKSATNWSAYASIIQAIPDDIQPVE